MHVCVYIYVCVRACIVLRENQFVEKKKRIVTVGEEKKTARKQNYINACFTCLRLNVTLLYIGVHIHIRTHAHTCGD